MKGGAKGGKRSDLTTVPHMEYNAHKQVGRGDSDEYEREDEVPFARGTHRKY